MASEIFEVCKRILARSLSYKQRQDYNGMMKPVLMWPYLILYI